MRLACYSYCTLLNILLFPVLIVELIALNSPVTKKWESGWCFSSSGWNTLSLASMLRYSSSDSWHKRVQIRLEFCYPVEDVPYLSGVSPEPPCTPGAALPCHIHTHTHTQRDTSDISATSRYVCEFVSRMHRHFYLFVCDLFPFSVTRPPTVRTWRHSDGPMHTNTGRYSGEFSISIKWRVGKPNKTLFMFEREGKVFDEDPCGIIVVHATSSMHCFHCMCIYLVKRIR